MVCKIIAISSAKPDNFQTFEDNFQKIFFSVFRANIIWFRIVFNLKNVFFEFLSNFKNKKTALFYFVIFLYPNLLI
jgi:hypothetical protein